MQAQVDDHYAEVGEVIETYSEPVVQDIDGWESEAGANYAQSDHADHSAAYEDEIPAVGAFKHCRDAAG